MTEEKSETYNARHCLEIREPATDISYLSKPDLCPYTIFCVKTKTQEEETVSNMWKGMRPLSILALAFAITFAMACTKEVEVEVIKEVPVEVVKLSLIHI